MSSLTVRTAIKSFITTNAPTEKLIDLTAEFQNLNDLLDSNSASNGPWLGIQFIGNAEEAVGLTANNTQGKYLEDGVIYLHIVDLASLGIANSILTRAEALRDLFRGQRIGDITIRAVAPANFEAGGTLQFESGYTAASVLIAYDRRFDI